MFHFEFLLHRLVVVGFWYVELLVEVVVFDGDSVGDGADYVPLGLELVPVLVGRLVPDETSGEVDAESFEYGSQTCVEDGEYELLVALGLGVFHLLVHFAERAGALVALFCGECFYDEIGIRFFGKSIRDTLRIVKNWRSKR